MIVVAVLCRVDRRVDLGRVETDVLHDVDLTAARPADFVNIRAEHPDGGPCAAASREFGADFNATVGPGRFAVGRDAPGRVFRLLAVFFVILADALDHEFSVLLVNVFLAFSRVELSLTVPHEAVLVAPFGGVGKARAFEFVVPDELERLAVVRRDGLRNARQAERRQQNGEAENQFFHFGFPLSQGF